LHDQSPSATSASLPDSSHPLFPYLNTKLSKQNLFSLIPTSSEHACFQG
jgi:hypothetical protein